MIFLIYKIILEIYKIDGGKNFETSNFYKNRLKTRVLRKKIIKNETAEKNLQPAAVLSSVSWFNVLKYVTFLKKWKS